GRVAAQAVPRLPGQARAPRTGTGHRREPVGASPRRGCERRAYRHSVSVALERGLRGRGRVTAEQGPDLGLTEPPVPARSPDAADAPRGRPAGDRLRVNPKQSCYLTGRKQPLTISFHFATPPGSSCGACPKCRDNRGFYP